jgi:cell division protein FtsA
MRGRWFADKLTMENGKLKMSIYMEKSNYIVGIDLGSSKVVVAAASKDTDGRLNIIDLISKPMEGVERGEITNIEQVTLAARGALGELEANLGIKVSEVIAGMSGENTKCGISTYYVYIGGQDGEICEEDVAKLHESMNTLPPPEGCQVLDRVPQKYVIDAREETMKPVGRFGHRLESTYHFVLGNRNSVDRLQKAMSRLQVGTQKIYSNAQASAAAVLTDDERELGAAVIDMGAECTDICIWHDNIMRYVSVLPIGSDAINTDIKSMVKRVKAIEKLKVKHGYASVASIPADKADQSILIKGATKRDDTTISYMALTQIIEARLTELIELIVGEINDAGYADKLGAGIVLTGNGAKITGMETLFREKSKYDTRISGADTGLLNEESAKLAEDFGLTSIIGLLLLGTQEGRIATTANPLTKKSGEESREAKREVPHEEVRPEPERYEEDDDDSTDYEPEDRQKPRKIGWIKKLRNVFDLDIVDDSEER